MEGWKEGRKEGYIPSPTPICGLWFPAGTLTVVGIPSARKKKMLLLYSQYFYVLYQERSPVTRHWTIVMRFVINRNQLYR